MQERNKYWFLFTRSLFLLFLLFFSSAYTQVSDDQETPGEKPKQRLEIVKTDLFHYSTFGKDSVKIRKLIGHVHLRHDTTDIFCDSAYQFVDTSFVKMMSNCKIDMGQGKTIVADEMTYNSSTKVAELYNNIILSDSNINLYTNRMTYYREQDYGKYFGGGTIINKEDTLTSKRGFYYPKDDMAHFKDNVKLVNPSYTLTTDTLGYNTEKETAYFLAPTIVVDSNTRMFTEGGYYDTRNDYAYLYQNTRISDSTYVMFADTIVYDKLHDFGYAKKDIKIMQSDSGLTVYGQYAEFHEKNNYTFITDSAFAVQYFDTDTLFLFGDTLVSIEDTAFSQKVFSAFPDVTFYMNDFQGICDSLAYLYDDSLIWFYRDPVLWSEESQLLGDTIMIGMHKSDIDTMSIPSKPFIISREDTVGFNQIKGKKMHASFENNQMDKMWILGKSESLYFTKDDKDKYMGMNSAKCWNMFVTFKENKPSMIRFEQKPEGEFFPMWMIVEKENKLEGFRWREDERPERPDWLVYKLKNIEPPVDSLRLQLDTINDLINLLSKKLDSLLKDSLFIIKAGQDSMGIDSMHTAIDTAGGAVDTTGIDSAGVPGKIRNVVQDSSSTAKGKVKGRKKVKDDRPFKEKWKDFWEPDEGAAAMRKKKRIEKRVKRLKKKESRKKKRAKPLQFKNE